MDFDLFVIGGGSAGVRCARIAAGHGARVGVAEERFWGGTCVNVGCVPKKLLVQAGEYGAWADDAAGFGWTIKKGPHDWAKLIAAKDREIGRLNGIYKRLLDNAGATIFESRATFVDAAHARCRRQARHRGAHRHRHRRASGAACQSPARNSASSPTMRSTCRTCRSAWRSSARGYIAVEFAGIFAGLGAHVDLVYRQPLPLRGFDIDLRESLAEALGAQGITLHPGCRPTKIEADGDERVLTLRRRTNVAHRPGVLRHRPRAGNEGARSRQGRRDAERRRRGDGRSAPAHRAAAHLRHGRRHRSAEPDAGRDRRGPRAGRHAVRQATRAASRCTTCRPRCSPRRRSPPAA